MKTGKLRGVTTVEAAGIITHLGGKTLLYRDAPLLSETQVPEVVEEFKANGCDCILFDSGAVFDGIAYGHAMHCVDDIKKKFGDKLKVVIFNL